MIVDFSFAQIRSKVNLPASKSIANRLLIISALAEVSLPVSKQGEAADTSILRVLLNSNESTKNAGLAGTTFRFLTAYLSQKPGLHYLTGEERMLLRPISLLVSALKTLGAQITYQGEQGYPPLQIEGCTLQGGYVEIGGGVSSQFLSSLLMVAPMMKTGMTMKVMPPFYSQPYVEMTVSLMQRCGVKVERDGDVFKIEPQLYNHVVSEVEADWSAASYWYELIAVGAMDSVELIGLHENSIQGDAVCENLFKIFGVETVHTSSGILLQKVPVSLPDKLEMDCNGCPDLVQTLVCTCAGLGVVGSFYGIQTLRVKETDRVAALIKELGKLGVICSATEDEFKIESFESFKDSSIETYNDHRMAMAFAPLAVKFGALNIQNPEVVSKSYPNFWDDLGFAISK